MTYQNGDTATPINSSERFLTLPQAAKQLGIPASTLRRAANAGLIKVHRPFSNRLRVRLSEVNAAIDAAENGGCDE